jgi:hypothetical protein
MSDLSALSFISSEYYQNPHNSDIGGITDITGNSDIGIVPRETSNPTRPPKLSTEVIHNVHKAVDKELQFRYQNWLVDFP